jgi:hypothetical protein
MKYVYTYKSAPALEDGLTKTNCDVVIFRAVVHLMLSPQNGYLCRQSDNFHEILNNLRPLKKSCWPLRIFIFGCLCTDFSLN